MAARPHGVSVVSSPIRLAEYLRAKRAAFVFAVILFLALIITSMWLWPTFWKEHWGDVATLLGLAISVVGFYWTMQLAVESKDAAERAEEASNHARRIIQGFDAVIVISQACAHLDYIMQMHRDNGWRFLPERYAQVRTMLVAVKSAASRLSEDQRLKVGGVLLQLNHIHSKIDGWLIAKKESPPAKASSMLEIIKVQKDHLTDILTELRNGSAE